ncbi:MAG TPA: ABC transporter ATP-binding protein [Acidimicrobiales bacterium]|jgi:ABC-2 type transport system ATP-binding protein|nr:ABC transporter ATP-binding protein [Acidimicrobiales bacterium]
MFQLANKDPLVVRGVTKTFTSKRGRRQVHAVRDVSFTVSRGSIFGLIGANGSGKSTLIRMLSTLVLADAGRVEVFGYDIERDSMEARQLINRVSADPSFFRQMSALENLLFFGRVYGLAGNDVRARAESILDRLGLGRAHQRAMVKELSRGQQQKIAVARAFLTSPVLMLLDEPTTGLDPRSKHDVQEFIREVQRDHDATILLTTHDMDEAEALCDRISFLVGGSIVAEGTSLELRRSVANGRDVEDIDMEDVFMALTGKSVEDDEEEDAFA